MTMPCHITDQRLPNDPQNAVDETRPDGCECLTGGEEWGLRPAEDHDPDNERCPLYECDCGHEKREHGPQGCEVELGDRYCGKELMEAGGPCDCRLTPKQIELRARGLNECDACGHGRKEHGAVGCEHVVSPNRHVFCACKLTAEEVRV